MTLFFHWIIAYCKTTKRIGTLNFTNMNFQFVVINLLMVCLSVAGHTTQGYTGCPKHVCFLLGLRLVTSKRSGIRSKRICGTGYFNDFVCRLVSLCLPSVSLTRPLSPLLSLSSCRQLLLGLVSSSAPPLKALVFFCSEMNAIACGYQRVCQET